MTEKRKYRRLSESEWAEARALWEVGDSSLEELSAHFGVSKRTLQFHFSKHGLAKGSKARELTAAVEKEVFRRELTDKDLLVEWARDIKERTYANAQVIENLVMAQLDLAQKDPSQAYKASSAMKILSLAASTLERTHQLKKTALGLDKDPAIAEELPVLIFRDLSKEDLEKIQAGHDEKWGDDDVIEGPEHERASDPDDDPEGEENEIVEIRPREAGEHLPTIDGCRLVRSAR
jgi:hypothetical protein